MTNEKPGKLVLSSPLVFYLPNVCIHFISAALYYLISWPEEDDAMSVVADHMIVSPPAKEIIPGVMCKVKGFEKNLSKVVAAGTKAEMNSKLDRMEDSEDEAIKPPKKKARLEGKENKVPPKPKPSKRRPQNKKEPGRYYVILRAQCVCVRCGVCTLCVCVCVCVYVCDVVYVLVCVCADML